MEEADSSLILKSLLSGGLAGMAGKSFVAPLDRVKILLQTHNEGFKQKGVLSSLGSIVAEEGVSGLFRGNGVQMLRVFPYGAIQFSSYEVFKRILDYKSEGSGGSVVRIAAGSLGGLCGVVSTYPLDTLRARLAVHSKAGSDGYNGIRQSVRTITAKDGVKGFYRGLMPSVLAIIPLSGLTFFFFETLKNFLLKHSIFRVQEIKHGDKKGDYISGENVRFQLRTSGKLLCGGCAGALAQSFSYPLDVARRRMQVGGAGATSMLNVLKNTYYTDGISRGLYRGMSINFIRAFPLSAVTFSTYESLKQLLGISTAVNIKLG